MFQKAVKACFWIIVCELVGILGSTFTISQIPTWYEHLNKPFFSPPNFVFGPVWTTLYALMGISIFLVTSGKIKKASRNNLIVFFSFQLFLNFLWSVIFFGMHLIFPAFIEIICMWGVILLLIIKFYQYSQTASYLLIPYLAWVTVASLLNLSISLLNPI